MIYIYTPKKQAGAGSPSRVDLTRCRVQVRVRGMNWPIYHQCERLAKVNAKVDGVEYGFCNTHSPAAEKRREEASVRAFKRRMWPLERAGQLQAQLDSAVRLLKKCQRCGINRDLRAQIQKLLDKTT